MRLLFEHGAFTATDTAATAQALMWLALALPAHVLVKALSPAFFAREDTLTPLVATLKGVAVAIVLAVLLGHWFGASGIAAAHRARGLEHRADLDPPGRRDLRLLDRCRGARGGCRASSRPRWPWAGCCGSRRGCCRRSAAAAHGLLQAVVLVVADYRRDCDLRPVSAAFRRHRLARGG